MKLEIKAKCPVCKFHFELDSEDEEGGIVVCPNCEAKLEIDNLYPPELIKVKYTSDNELEDFVDREDEYGYEEEESDEEEEDTKESEEEKEEDEFFEEKRDDKQDDI